MVGKASFGITSSNTSKSEGSSGTTAFYYAITRSGDTSGTSSVSWSVGGSGTNPADALDFKGGALPGGLVTFAAGETSKLITINVAADKSFEADERFTVTLSAPSDGAVVKTATMGGTILNDDVPASLSVSAADADHAEGNAGSTPFTFTVTRGGDLSGESSAHWAITGSGASPATAADFAGGILPDGTVNFAVGESSKTVTVDVAGDRLAEADDMFDFTLSAPSFGTVIATASVAGIIHNDDFPPALAIATLDADKAEGGSGALTPFTFTVMRTGDSSGVSSAKWTVSGNGSTPATATDFPGDKFPTGTVSFAAGETSKTITVNVEGDKGVEPDNGFKVTLSGASSGTSITTASAAGTIRNDDGIAVEPPVFAVTATNADHAEGNSGTSPFTFTVTRSGGTTKTDIVDWHVSGSIDAADFGGTIPGGSVTFAPGETSKLVSLAVTGDTLLEDDEFFALSIHDHVNGSNIGAAYGNIRNDEARPPSILTISADAASKAEGNTGELTPFTFTVSRGGDLGRESSVTWTVSGNGSTPAAANDFPGDKFPTGTVHFDVDESFKTITIYVEGDKGVEPDNGFKVTLSGASAGATITTAVANAIIRNDDSAASGGAPSYGIAPLNADHAEGDSGTTAFTFTVSRTGDTSQAGSVDWKASGVPTYFAGSVPSGTVTFGAGETSKTITIQTSTDTSASVDKTFSVDLFTAGTTQQISGAHAVGVVRNDDYAFQVDATPVLNVEGNAGAQPYSFTITSLGTTDHNVSVHWAVTGSGTNAANAADFVGGVLPSGDVVFAPGETSKTVSVAVNGDLTPENWETFSFGLTSSSETNAKLSGSASGTIVDDDAKITITALDADKAEGNSGTTPFTFLVTRSGDSSSTLTANWKANGASPDDFASATNGTIDFAVGETSKVITVGVRGDALVESDEGFTVLAYTGPGGLTIGSSSTAVGTIRNDDVPSPGHFSIAASDADHAEGNTGSTAYTFLVTRDGDTSTAGSVAWKVGQTDGSTVQPNDFPNGTLPGGIVAFAPGETQHVVTVNVSGDREHESDERFAVTLSAPVGATLSTGSSAFGLVRDDDPAGTPTISINPYFVSTREGDLMAYSIDRSGDLSAAASITWSVSGTGDHPTNAADFGGALPGGTLIFSAGSAHQTVFFSTGSDKDLEADETYVVSLSQPSAGLTIGTGSAFNTIVDDDSGGSIVTAATSVVEGSEGSTPFTFTINRTSAITTADSLNWSVSGTGFYAADAVDFVGGVLPGGTVNFAAGEASKTVTINIAGDTAEEKAETFAISVAQPGQASPIGAPKVVTIANDDIPSFHITAVNADMAEGNGGTTPFTFLVTRAGAADTSTSTQANWYIPANDLQYKVSGNDFSATSGSVVFAAGETSKLLTVYVTGDSSFESDENFTIRVVTPGYGEEYGSSDAFGIIRNDDSAPPALTIVATSADKAEGQLGSTPFTFTITRSQDISTATEVQWVVQSPSGSTLNGSDFVGGQLPVGSVSFGVGETSKVITVNVAGDTLIESSEIFTVAISTTTGATILASSAIGTIRTDDFTAPVLAIAAKENNKFEGDSGTTAFTFTVTRSGDISGTSSAKWAVAGSGSDAAASADFVGGIKPSGIVTFAAGETSKIVTVEVQGDTTVEADNAFSVTLSTPSSGTTLGTSVAYGVIRNDDVAALSKASASFASASATTADMMILRSLDPIEPSFAVGADFHLSFKGAAVEEDLFEATGRLHASPAEFAFV